MLKTKIAATVLSLACAGPVMALAAPAGATTVSGTQASAPSYGPWTSWVTTSTTACRKKAPAVRGTNTDTTQYRVTSNGAGVGCPAAKATFNQQTRTRVKMDG